MKLLLSKQAILLCCFMIGDVNGSDKGFSNQLTETERKSRLEQFGLNSRKYPPKRKTTIPERKVRTPSESSEGAEKDTHRCSRYWDISIENSLGEERERMLNSPPTFPVFISPALFFGTESGTHEDDMTIGETVSNSPGSPPSNESVLMEPKQRSEPVVINKLNGQSSATTSRSFDSYDNPYIDPNALQKELDRLSSSYGLVGTK